MQNAVIEKKNKRILGRHQLESVLGRLQEGVYKITISKMRHVRSSNQNRWLWGQIYPMMLQGFVDLGHDELTCEEDVHEFCKVMFAGKQIVNKTTGEIVTIPCRTHEMDTVEFALYCEQLRIFAKDYLNVSIPEPQPLTLQQ